MRTPPAFALLCLFAASTALAGPVIPHSGYLLGPSDTPVTQTVPMSFRLFASPTGGAATWTETHSLAVRAGYYAVTLGEQSALSDTALAQPVVYLGVFVDGVELLPRVTLVPVAYALRAASAATADNAIGHLTPASVTVGTLALEAVGLTANGSVLIDPQGKWKGAAPAIERSADFAGNGTIEAPLSIAASAFQAVARSGAYADLSGKPTTFEGFPCAAGQVVKRTASGWECASDQDTTYAAGNGLTLNSGQFAANPAAVQTRIVNPCGAGMAIRAVNQDGSVTCETTGDTALDLGDRLIYAQDAEQKALEVNAGEGWVLMNEATLSRAGSVRVGFEAMIVSGPDYFAWRLTRNGASLQTGTFGTGLHSSNTASVHAYRRFQVDVSGLAAGERLGVWMKASAVDGSGIGTGGSQNLQIKRFRVFANRPTSTGGVFASAIYRGYLTNDAAIELADGGYVLFTAVENSNADVFETVAAGNGGVRFKRAGHVFYQFDQDVIATGGSYVWLMAQTTGDAQSKALISPTAGVWDMINISGAAQVAAGDTLEILVGSGGTDITALDTSTWSNLSIMWTGSLDP